MFPAWLRENGQLKANLRQAKHAGEKTVLHYLDRIGASVEDLFHHVLATLHDPDYRAANAGALRMEWPRIPLPDWPDGEAEGAANALARSAARGRELAALLDPDSPVPGVTQAPLRPEVAAVAVPATTGGRNMAGDDFAVTAGWGHHGQGDAVMPGQGRTVERAFTPEERAATGDTPPALGDATFDVYLNADAFWRNVPTAVWNYKLGGYQVLKKWLSYRERAHSRTPASGGRSAALYRYRPADRRDLVANNRQSEGVTTIRNSEGLLRRMGSRSTPSRHVRSAADPAQVPAPRLSPGRASRSGCPPWCSRRSRAARWAGTWTGPRARR